MQIAKQSPEQARRRPGQFQPGQSGNPTGRESAAARRARVNAIVEQWCAELGGKVGTADRAMLERAAELSLVRPRKSEDAVRVANSISKLLAQAGFHRHRRKKTEPSVIARMAFGEGADDGPSG